MGRPPSLSQDKFIIRLPDGMRERIKAAADANGRTMTAEIVWRLEQSLTGVEARLSSQETRTDEVSNLANLGYEEGLELNMRVEAIEGFIDRMLPLWKVEGPGDHDVDRIRKKREDAGS